MDFPQDQIAERRELLQRCLGMSVIQAQSYAQKLDDEKFTEVINGISRDLVGMNMRRPDTFPDYFFGRYYTIENCKIKVGSEWEKVEGEILTCLVSERQAKEVLEYFLHQPDYQADFAGVKARFSRWRNTLDSLLGFRLIYKLPATGKDRTVYALRGEISPLIRDVLESPKAAELPVINSEAAQAELAHVQQMERVFEEYLTELLNDRADEVIEFGHSTMSLELVCRYLEDLFGPMLYFDNVLAIAHQYGMTSTEIVNPEGTRAGSTGFHLALFGAPGTGKTFAVKDLIMGDEGKNVLPHGLPGLNRYCGGMTAANFIRIGEAYQSKRFNFVVTEFNDWFRYKGMVEPLKLALEQGRIRYETKNETIGPYQFICYFSTNYNTDVNKDAGYRVTIGDPNFNAIEDRMLVRMHRMTKQRLRELSRNQRELALGRLRMGQAKDIRDHLTLVYAIQTEHPLVKERFSPKKVIVRESFFEALDRAQEVVLQEIHGPLQFSVRVRQNAMKLAATLTLFSYFSQQTNRLEITPDAQRLALKFFVEEIAIRQKAAVDVESMLYRLGLSDLNRLAAAAESGRRRARVADDGDAALNEWRNHMRHELKLIESRYGFEEGWERHVHDLKDRFKDGWSSLDDTVKQFLCTAEVVLREISRLAGEQADFSAVVIEYSKALELQLHHVCFETFRQHVMERDLHSKPVFFELDEEVAGLSPSDKRSVQRTVDSLRGFVLDEQRLTLGQMWYCLLRARREQPGAPVLAALRSHCQSDSTLQRVLTKGFVSDLSEYIDTLRNSAAHTTALSRAEAEKCRSAILDESTGLFTATIAPTNVAAA